jgi:putative ABC transport system permease protein
MRFFRALLRLLPFDFRLEHGREMEQLFRAQRHEAREEGTVRAVARLWFETVHDLLTTAPRQHASMLRQDAAYALRTLARTPAFTMAALATLAVGISTTAVIFTIINAFLFRPLPVDRPGELVSIASLDQHFEMPHGMSWPDLRDYESLTGVFTGMMGVEPHGSWLRARNRGERVILEALTENGFSLLGVRPALGRVFTPADARTPVIVLAHDYWQSRFGGDPSVIGEGIRLDGQAFTIIGVADRRFRGLESLIRVSAFVPLSSLDQLSPGAMARSEWRDRHQLWVVGRLAPGVGIETARAALAARAHTLAQQYPATNAGVSLYVVPETQARPVPQNGPMFHVAATALTGLAGLLLLITSANIANMLLARAASRGREIALRAALGARRGRLVRQLVTESVLLALLGGAGAVLLAALAAAAMERGITSLSNEVPLRVDFGLDWRVFAVTFVVAAGAGCLAGLAPALYARRADLDSLLKTGGRRAGADRSRLRGVLVGAQIAVSLVLLVVGGLFARTLDRARTADLGIRVDNVLNAKVDFPPQTHDPVRRAAYYRDARDRVAALPGVRNAAWITGVPFGYEMNSVEVEVAGRPGGPGQNPVTFSVSVGPEYFAAASVAIVSGRGFDARDAAGAPETAVINETLARTLWPADNPLGRRLTLRPSGPEVEVVGVARDGKYVFLWEAPRGMLFRPLPQTNPTLATLEVVTAGRPELAATAVQAALQAVDPEVPVFAVQTMQDYLEYGSAFLMFRIGALFTGVFGAIGLLLASIGLYGVVAYDVAQRTHEIGVRKALGALGADILREVAWRSARLVIPGAIAGAAIAAALGWTVRTMLLDVSPFDPATYARTTFVLLAVSALAALLPARRAASANPVDTLRGE